MMTNSEHKIEAAKDDPAQMTPKELKFARQAESDARMTVEVTFGTARAYHASARSLMKNPIPKLGHREAPIRALFHHAAELYLKAFLLHSGKTPAQIREHRHDYERLAEDAQDHDLKLAPEFVDCLKSLQQLGAFSRARYQSVGFQSHIELERLNDLCNALAPLVGRSMTLVRTSVIEPI